MFNITLYCHAQSQEDKGFNRINTTRTSFRRGNMRNNRRNYRTRRLSSGSGIISWICLGFLPVGIGNDTKRRFRHRS